MILIRGGTLVDDAGERPGDVLLDGERIAAVGGSLDAPGAEIIDASGALVIPGGIDPHTHFDLPVGAARSADDFPSGTVAAACGGTTCVIDFAGAGREPAEDALRTWHQKAGGRATIDYGFHLTVTSLPDQSELVERFFARLVEQGVTSVKLYMAYPERLMVDDATLARALAASRAAGVLVCVHAEDGNEADRLTRELLREGQMSPGTLSMARPPAVEASAIRRAASLAREAGAALYIVHLSSAAGLEEVQAAQAGGGMVIAETCPQYLFLSDDRLDGSPEEAANFVCTPPLRGATDRTALWKGLADGSIQAVSTDHCPFTKRDRRRGTVAGKERWSNFTQIPGGLPGVETRVTLAYQGVRDGRWSVTRWVEAVSTVPADVFGLAGRKGRLRPGLDADVVVFDPAATRQLDAAALHMLTDHSPYQGMEVVGWPALVFSRGRLVARDGEPADTEAGWGKFVPRRRFG